MNEKLVKLKTQNIYKCISLLLVKSKTSIYNVYNNEMNIFFMIEIARLTFFIFYILNVITRDLYYMSLIGGDYSGYVKDMSTHVPIYVITDKVQAKKFWLSQQPNNEYKVKVRCGEGGSDVLSNSKATELIFEPNSGSKDNIQYFTIEKTPEYVEGSRWVYAFSLNNNYVTYNGSILILAPKNSNLKNQKYEFLHIQDKKDIPPVTFSVKPTEPVTPTTPTEPAKPTEPTTPTDPAAPTSPTDPAAPTSPTDPAAPTSPTDPAAKPSDPTAPSSPATTTPDGSQPPNANGLPGLTGSGSSSGAGSLPGYGNSPGSSSNINPSGTFPLSLAIGDPSIGDRMICAPFGYGGKGLFSGYNEAIFDVIKRNSPKICPC